MEFKRLIQSVRGHSRLPKDPEEENRKTVAKEEAAAARGVEEYVHRKVVDFVQDFGAKILPSPYGDKGEALAVQEIRFQVLRYHDQCKVSLYHDANEALHVEANGIYCPMMLTDSSTPGHPQIRAFKVNNKKYPNERNSNDSEFFALPRPILYYINSKGVHKSSRGTAFAEGQWGARPSQEACTYSKLLPLLSRESALTTPAAHVVETKAGDLWRALDLTILARKAKWSVSLDEEGIPNHLKLYMPRSFTVTFSCDFNPHAGRNPHVAVARTRV